MPWGEDSACVFGCAHNVIPLPVVGATVHELERRQVLRPDLKWDGQPEAEASFERSPAAVTPVALARYVIQHLYRLLCTPLHQPRRHLREDA